MKRRLEDQGLFFRLADARKKFIIEGRYDPIYGARPLKRYLQKYVETLTAKLILSGNVGTEDTIVIDVENGEASSPQGMRGERDYDTKRSGDAFKLCKHEAERFYSYSG